MMAEQRWQEQESVDLHLEQKQETWREHGEWCKPQSHALSDALPTAEPHFLSLPQLPYKVFKSPDCGETAHSNHNTYPYLASPVCHCNKRSDLTTLFAVLAQRAAASEYFVLPMKREKKLKSTPLNASQLSGTSICSFFVLLG